ncbi:MAG: DUF489 family protein, partial [Gammaproteobacteria bacterium]
MSTDFSPWQYQVLSLAAVAQSSTLVHQLAASGELSSEMLVDTLNPLLVLDPGSVADVFPAPAQFSLGLQMLQDVFSNERVRRHGYQVRYLLGMLILRNRLARNGPMQNLIREKLSQVKPLQGLSHDDSETANDAEQLAAGVRQLSRLYQETISTLPYRIQVQGKIEHLKDDYVANCIRALLLAGIRAAFLW